MEEGEKVSCKNCRFAEMTEDATGDIMCNILVENDFKGIEARVRADDIGKLRCDHWKQEMYTYKLR